jgi:hypothetical protein
MFPFARRTRRRDGEHERPLTLPCRERDRIPHLAGDDVELVDDRERRVPPLERAGRRGQHDERARRVRDLDAVREDLRLLGEARAQLHHADALPQDDPGLPLITCDDDDLGALDAIGEQPEEGEHRG